jgi:hypothetical protein
MAKIIYRTQQKPSLDFQGKAEAIAILHAILQGVTFNFEVEAEPDEVLTDAVMMDATMKDLARQVVEHPLFHKIFDEVQDAMIFGADDFVS